LTWKGEDLQQRDDGKEKNYGKFGISNFPLSRHLFLTVE